MLKRIYYFIQVDIRRVVSLMITDYSIYNILLDIFISVLAPPDKKKPLLVGPSIAMERLSVCNKCIDKFSIFPNRYNCRLCGCFIDAKVKFAKTSCPALKWLVCND